MHKSNNTKRKETWGNSGRKRPNSAASIMSDFSKSGDTNKQTLLLCKNTSLRWQHAEIQLQFTESSHPNKPQTLRLVSNRIEMTCFNAFLKTRNYFGLQNSWHTHTHKFNTKTREQTEGKKKPIPFVKSAMLLCWKGQKQVNYSSLYS